MLLRLALVAVGLGMFSFGAFSKPAFGSLDSSFGKKGIAQAGICGAKQILMLPDQSMIIFKQSKETMTLLKLTQSGLWDSTFANKGVLRIESGWDAEQSRLVLQKNLDIALISGDATNLQRMRISPLGRVLNQSKFDFPKLNDLAPSLVRWTRNNTFFAVYQANQKLLIARYTGQLELDTSFGTAGLTELSTITPAILAQLSAFGSATPSIEIMGLTVADDGSLILTATIDFVGRRLMLAKFRANGQLETGFADNGVDIDGLAYEISSYFAVRVLPNQGLVMFRGLDNSPQGDAEFYSALWFGATGSLEDSQTLGEAQSQNFRAWSFATGDVFLLENSKIKLLRNQAKPRQLIAKLQQLEILEQTTDGKVIIGECVKKQLLLRRLHL